MITVAARWLGCLMGVFDMTLDRAVMAFAGVMVLISVLLTSLVSPYFLWFTVFIGVNLIQSSFTGFCPAAMVMKKLGLRPGTAF
jgi:Protein of unknown function (DUF2892)